MHRVIIRQRALADIDEAYRWHEEQRAGLGADFMSELERVSDFLEQDTELYQRVRGPVRRALLRRFPYGVFYVVRPPLVSVIAVLHHARDPKHWQSRVRLAR